MRRVERASRSTLRTRLEARRPEIEEAALTRVNAIADPSEATDPTYAEGLRGAVAAALDYGLAAIEHGGEEGPPIPVVLLAQARVAARNAVSLDTVLRRYFAGYSLLGYFLIEEAAGDGLMSGAELQRLLGAQSVLFDRLLAAIAEEHARESELRPTSSRQRLVERIERLLAGELTDTAEIAYDFQGWHLGLVAVGPEAADTTRALAERLDCRLLSVKRENGVVWAWLGSRLGSQALRMDSLESPPGVTLALGEPGESLAGWRLTHRQALAALSVARQGGESLVRYLDVALLASALQDDLLSASLRQLYLVPLQSERDGGRVAKETLRAYFAAGRNMSSTAAALGVRRHTVSSRLRASEERTGRPIDVCAAELDTALRLDQLGRPHRSLDAEPSVHSGRATLAVE